MISNHRARQVAARSDRAQGVDGQVRVAKRHRFRNRRHEASLTRDELPAPDANELAGAPITPKAPSGLGGWEVGAGLPSLEYQLAG